MTLHQTIRSSVMRDATAEDADTLRRVFELASHGLAETFWRKAHAPDTDYDTHVRKRMEARIADPVNRFRVAEVFGVPAGGILSYEKTDEPDDPGDAGPMLRAIILAENDLLNTHYIDALAVFPAFQGRGIGQALIADVGRAARQPLSLIAADGNPGALRLYRRLGFREVGRHGIHAEDWEPNGTNWVTMIRDV